MESDGERLMIERALAGALTGVEPERASRLYDDAKKEFDRRFYTLLYIRFGGNLSQIAKAAGKQRVTVRTALREIGLHDDAESTRNAHENTQLSKQQTIGVLSPQILALRSKG